MANSKLIDEGITLATTLLDLTREANATPQDALQICSVAYRLLQGAIPRGQVMGLLQEANAIYDAYATTGRHDHQNLN